MAMRSCRKYFDITADNCRQILKRSKEHLGKDSRRFEEWISKSTKKIPEQFHPGHHGRRHGRFLIALLKEDIQVYADGGGNTFIVDGQRTHRFCEASPGKGKYQQVPAELRPPALQALPADHNRELIFANGMPSILTRSRFNSRKPCLAGDGWGADPEYLCTDQPWTNSPISSK